MGDKELRRAAAASMLSKRAAIFDKHDMDRDQQMDKSEVASYSKVEFGFVLSDQALAQIMNKLASAGGGVPEEKHHHLRIAIGIARDAELFRTRRKLEEGQQTAK